MCRIFLLALFNLESRNEPALDAQRHAARLLDPARLAALTATGLMDSEAEPAFDRFTRLASKWLQAPVALVSMVDDHRQFFKSAQGLDEPWATLRQMPLDLSFCQYTVTSAAPLIVMDAREHPVLSKNLAVEQLGVLAYAGMPLFGAEQQVLGALCVSDTRPRAWSEEDVAVLRELAALATTEIELRYKVQSLQRAEAEKEHDRRLLRSVLDCMDDMVIVTDLTGQTLLTNEAAERLLTPTFLAAAKDGQPPHAFLSDGVTPFTAEHSPTRRALTGEAVRDVEFVNLTPGQPERSHRINASPIRDGKGEIYAAVCVARDNTQARKARSALARSEALFRTVVRNLPNGAVLLFDSDLRYLMADGEALLASIGLSSQALVGKTLQEIASPERVAAMTDRYRAALAGEPQSFEVTRASRTYAITVVPVRDGRSVVTAGMVLIYDVTAHKRIEDDLRRRTEEVHGLSIRDELTGLYNRRGFMELGRHALSLAEQTSKPSLLFFIDLNGMKRINDELGHEQGDQALIETAQVLRASFRPSALLARLGGDEFVVLVPDAARAELAELQGRVQAEIAARNAQVGRLYRLSASIGATEHDAAHAETIDTLLARADTLMYEQKRIRKLAGGSLAPGPPSVVRRS